MNRRTLDSWSARPPAGTGWSLVSWGAGNLADINLSVVGTGNSGERVSVIAVCLMIPFGYGSK